MANGQYVKDSERRVRVDEHDRLSEEDEGRRRSRRSSRPRSASRTATRSSRYGPQGLFREVDSAGKTVWEYENPRFTVRKDTPKESGAGIPIQPWWTFRAEHYDPTYSGLAELNP